MPFRLTNAPATFCNLMNDVLFNFLDSFMVVYLDNIVIYSPTLEDHVVHLEKVLERLRQTSCMSRKRSVSLLKRDQVFGSFDFNVSYSDGWCKGGSKSRLACPDQGDKTSIVPRLIKLLQEIYYGLC